jgi:hypothetical protein
MNDTHSRERVIKADKRVRMLVIIAWIVCVLVGVVLLRWVMPWGQGRFEQAEPDVALRVIQLVIGLVSLSIIPFGVYLYRFGRRAIKHRQMPPPGTTVIMDTQVLEGDKAVMRGRLTMVMGLVLLVLGRAGGLYLP